MQVKRAKVIAAERTPLEAAIFLERDLRLVDTYRKKYGDAYCGMTYDGQLPIVWSETNVPQVPRGKREII